MREPASHVACALPELTHAMAPTLCAAALDHLERGHGAWKLDLRHAGRVDAFGLAALLQAVQRLRLAGIEAVLLGNALVRRAVVDAHLVEELPVADLATTSRPHADASETRRYLASTDRMGLRVPRDGDLTFFAKWAEDRELEQLVGSDLLYRCRHLGVDHPSVRHALVGDPCSVTLLVEPRDRDAAPIGYVRLYQIHLADGFAFLETAVADPEYRRGGRSAWGVVATHVFLGLAVDALELNRIEAKAYANNRLSCNALRRRGFSLEGVLREAHRWDGRRADIAVFALFGDEMRARRYRDPLPYRGFWPREFHASARAVAAIPVPDPA
jgi:RimJ/RimL family protein N-acetyltransferase/anti-anti-sigma regulatory factor